MRRVPQALPGAVTVTPFRFPELTPQKFPGATPTDPCPPFFFPCRPYPPPLRAWSPMPCGHNQRGTPPSNLTTHIINLGRTSGCQTVNSDHLLCHGGLWSGPAELLVDRPLLSPPREVGDTRPHREERRETPASVGRRMSQGRRRVSRGTPRILCTEAAPPLCFLLLFVHTLSKRFPLFALFWPQPHAYAGDLET